jgi:hypothetical protein
MLKYIDRTDTLYLRSTVLRNNIPEQECVFDTDDIGFHLGAFVDDELVSVATFFPEDYPDLVREVTDCGEWPRLSCFPTRDMAPG